VWPGDKDRTQVRTKSGPRVMAALRNGGTRITRRYCMDCDSELRTNSPDPLQPVAKDDEGVSFLVNYTLQKSNTLTNNRLEGISNVYL